MAPARLKSMMHFADGTPDVPSGSIPLGNPWGAILAAISSGAGKTPTARKGGYPAAPSNPAPTAGMPLPSTPALVAPVAAAPAPAPAGGSIYDAVRQSPDTRQSLADLFRGKSYQLSVGDTALPQGSPAASARPQLREARVGDVNANPGLPGGDVPDVVRGGRMAGLGVPLQARIGQMMMPAAGKAALDIYNESDQERIARSMDALKAAGGNVNDPGYIRARQQIDAEHSLRLYQLMAGQQFNMMQLMQSGQMGLNPTMMGGYGYPTQ